MLRLLLVEDDSASASSIRDAVPKTWKLHHLDRISEKPTQALACSYHAALVDLHLGAQSKYDGFSVIRELRNLNPHLEIVVISSETDRANMERTLSLGATRFLPKPIAPRELALLLEKIEAWIALRDASQRKLAQRPVWIGESSVSQSIRRQISQSRGEQIPVLIEGESGTGKEVVAACLHAQEPQPRPFIAVNAASIPEALFESELFGHLKGSFTGAEQNKIGLIEAAHTGDLFLDEIDALPYTHQAKLLRFLETGEIRKVGAKENQKVQVRVIAATNKNLKQLVSEGRFRDDLVFRLDGTRIWLPPLRERTDDIPRLVQYFFEQDPYQRKKELTNDALERLKAFEFRGNVRELKRTCEALLKNSPLPVIRPEDIDLYLNHLPEFSGLMTTIDLSKGLPFLAEKFELNIISRALRQEKGDIDRACFLLQISRSSLYKKIKDFGIQLDEN